MSNQHIAAVLFTTNLRSMAQFYEHVAAMRVRSSEDDHIVLESDAFRLTVHQIPERYSRDIVITTPPAIRETNPIKLSYPIASISRAREAAARLGGCVYGPEREWKYESTIVCDGWDPDGKVFQLFQPVVAEGS